MIQTRRDFLRGTVAGAVVLGAGGVLAACGDDEPDASGEGEGSSTTTPEPLSITAMMPFPLAINFIADVVGISAGFFEEAGVEVDLQFATGAPQALQQLAAGNVTVIRNGPVETVQAMVDEDAPFMTIGMPNQRTNYALVSLPAAPLAIASNVLRVVALVVLALWNGVDILETFVHPLSGLLTFALVLPTLFWLGATPMLGRRT